MTSTGYHDTGEEWVQKTLYRQDQINSRETDVQVLLYNDNTDSLTDSDDIGAITSEPDAGSTNYARQSVSLDGSNVTLSQQSGEIRAALATVTFTTDDVSKTIDAAGVAIDFQSDVVNAEGSKNKHLLWTVSIGTTDLSNYNSIDVDANMDQG